MHNIPEDTYTPQNTSHNGKKVLILTADKVEDLEFFYPYYRLIEAGCDVTVATPKGGAFKGKHRLGLPNSQKIANLVSSADQFDMLYLPGGKAPSALRKLKEVLELVRQFVAAKKPIAAICHGPQILAAAEVIEARSISAWPEVEPEILASGGIYVNEQTALDGPFLTGRWPADLPAFTGRMMELLQRPGMMAGIAA